MGVVTLLDPEDAAAIQKLLNESRIRSGLALMRKKSCCTMFKTPFKHFPAPSRGWNKRGNF